MASPSDFPTGRTQLNRQLVEGAASLAGPAQDLASGAGLLKTASNAMRDAALDKLLGPTAVFAGGLVGVLRTVRSIVRESGLLEKGMRRIATMQGFEGRFETLLGSLTAAKRRIQELYQFMAKSPFDFGDVAEGNRVLQALTRGAYAGAKAMETVGDMAAATGQTLSATADKVGRLYAALASGRPFERVAFQLQYSGVVTDELAAKLESLESQGVSFSTKWAEVEKVLNRTAGGMKNAQSLDDLSGKLDRANAVMAEAFAEPYIEAQTKALRLMTRAAENLTPLIGEIGRDFSILPNFIRDAKNGLLDTFAASHRFAEALRVAYRVAVSLFVGLAGATLLMAARNLLGIGNAALSTAAGLRAAYAVTVAQAGAQKALATATALSAAASKAFAEGSLFSAAAMKAEAVWIGMKTRALATNAAALRVAGSGTAAFSVASYAANLATAGLAGTVHLARKAFALLFGIVRGSAVALLTNPWTATALAVLSVATALYKWSAATRQAADHARELAESIQDTTKRLNEQSAAVKTLTDWQTEVERLRSRYADLTAQVVEFNRRVANGETPTADEIAANARNVAERRLTRTALDREVRRNTRNLGLSDPETERIRQDQAERRAAKDNAARLAISSAQTPEQKLAAMDARKAELEARIRDGRAAKEGETRALRDGSAARRLELEQKRADVVAKFDQQKQLAADRKDGRMFNPLPRILAVGEIDAQIRAAGLGSASPTVRAQAQLDEAIRTNKGPDEVERLTRALEDARAAVAGLADAEAELADLIATQTQETRDFGRLEATRNMENEFDSRINAARAAGGPTAGLEFEKAMASLEVKRNDAQTPEEAQAAQNEIDAMNAEREAGRRRVELEREKNAALSRGDRKGAVAIEDAAALREKINQYAGLGLSAEAATTDFRAGLVADAAGRSPSIVADSMAAIGGGGGVIQGADPVLAAQERATRAAEQAAKDAGRAADLLAQIRDAVTDD